MLTRRSPPPHPCHCRRHDTTESARAAGAPNRGTAGTRVTIGVRPEDITLAGATGPGLTMTVDLVEELGADGFLYGHAIIDDERVNVTARVDGRTHPKAGNTISATPKAGRIHLLNVDTGERLNPGIVS